MKQLVRLIPLIRPKLPRLPPRHYTHHLPRVRAKLGQRLDRVHDEIGGPRDCFLPVAVDRGALAVDEGGSPSGLRLPSAVAGAQPSREGSKLHFWRLDQKKKRIWETYAEFSRKRLTLCMVMRAVGKEMMIMGLLLPAKQWVCS